MARLPQRLRIAEPCVGMGGVAEMFRICEMQYDGTNCYDIDPRLQKFHIGVAEAHGQAVRQGGFGAAGDIRSVDVKDLADSDVLACGPPCSPWAGTGARQGRLDPRSEVYFTVVEWVIYLAKRGSLLAFAIENSVATTHHLRGQCPS